MPEEEGKEGAAESMWMIPKLHVMSHYVQLIKTLGAAAHFSTDQSKHVHIQAAKVPYQKSNCFKFMMQIVHWLDLSERMREHNEYFNWRKAMESGSEDDQSDGEASKVDLDRCDNEEQVEVEDPGDGDDQFNELGDEELRMPDPGMESEPIEQYRVDNRTTHACPTWPSLLQVSLVQVTHEHEAADLYRQLQQTTFIVWAVLLPTIKLLVMSLMLFPSHTLTCISNFKFRFQLRHMSQKQQRGSPSKQP